LNELHTAGLSTPDFFTQDLKETSKISVLQTPSFFSSVVGGDS